MPMMEILGERDAVEVDWIKAREEVNTSLRKNDPVLLISNLECMCRRPKTGTKSKRGWNWSHFYMYNMPGTKTKLTKSSSPFITQVISLKYF